MAGRVEYDGLRRLLAEGAQLVEVLPRKEYDEEHLPGAVSIPVKELDADSTAGLDRRNPVVVYCWDYLWDLSPRAACRLETLGFEHVYDYVPGKVDWLARMQPTEGEEETDPRVGPLARDDVVTCAPDDPIDDVREAVERSPYGFALVVAGDGTLLGRLRGSVMKEAGTGSAESVMSPGPSTVRPDLPVAVLRKRLDEKDLKTSIVSTPEGKVIGVVKRSSLDQPEPG